MSQVKYASPLRFNILPSHLLITVMLLLHSGALAMLAICELHWMIKIVVATLLIISIYLVLHVQGCRVTPSPVKKVFPRIESVVWDNDDRWMLATENGKSLIATLCSASFVHPWITIINLKVEDAPWYSRYRNLILVPDNINAENFRRLRIRLRWYSTPNPDNSPVLK